MISSILLFLTPIFQSLIATAIFESGKAGVSFLADKKSMERRYKNAFERAIHRFYADPECVGNEARRVYGHYLKALKEDFKDAHDFNPQKGEYKELLELFEQEVCKDTRLRVWTYFKMFRTSAASLKQIENDQKKILEQLSGVKEETKQGLASINQKLDVIIESINASPELSRVSVLPVSLSVLQHADTKSLHLIQRQELVQQCVKHCNEGKVLVLYGGVKTGKRTLAELVLGNVSNGFVCTDVPSGHLNYVIRLCYQELLEGKKPVITTDAPIDENMTLVDMTHVAQVKVPLLTEKETKELIETYSPQHDFSKFIWAHSYGHPVLVRALCTYLSSCSWVIDESVFGKMLSYSFDRQLSRSLGELMQRMIPDAETRSLLNRLMLVKTTFTEDDVSALASINPQISEPRSKLLSLTPGWITDEEGCLKVTPLYDKAWTPDMDGECYKACNWLLASRVIVKKKTLNELDVLHYILYAQNAERYDDAGAMYMNALEKTGKEDLSKLTVLPSMWVDVPLPTQMNENLRIAIRIQQLIKLKNLSSGKKNYILDDLCRMVEGASENELTAVYYSTLSALCWAENRVQASMKYYNLSLSKRSKKSKGLEELEEINSLYKESVWFLPLRFTKLEEFDSWFEGFSAHPFEYDHSDPQICVHCYLSVYQFVNTVLKDLDTETIIERLQHLIEKAVSCQCPEMAVSVLFGMMELYNKAGQYENTKLVYKNYYEQYAQFPLATVLLNGSMAYSVYSDRNADNQEALHYIGLMHSAGYREIIPNIQLHMLQVESYILCETDLNAGIERMKDAISYVQQAGHSSTPYEYYQCVGELSYMYWEAGSRVLATELVSECVKYVTGEIGIKSPFAKTYLCLCDCLLVAYLNELKVREISEEQARPYRGMFTERDAHSLDCIYSKDRVFTSSYLMYQIADALKIEKLRTEWAYKVLDDIKNSGENKGIYFIATLLLPVFLKEQDFDAVARIAEISSVSQTKNFETHPEFKRGSADSEFIEFVITPALLLALRMSITGDSYGMKKINEILCSYKPVINDDVVKKVIAVFERGTYDEAYIEEVNILDVNKYYPVYICAYLITTLFVNSYQAFKLIMAVIVRLENDLVKVMGGEVKSIINEFISSLWRYRILTKPEEFVNYELLSSKGMKLIDKYDGMDNQANHTMLIVRHHLPGDVRLNEEQEKWLDS